ncbi:MAG TPA: oxidoreductase-like domain-containing protein [Casimicrobiaceae bacterium]
MTSADDEDVPPVPPVRPEPQECCGGGCSPCIFEQYDDALRRYEADLKLWRERQMKRSG